jgi:hypothetical protein
LVGVFLQHPHALIAFGMVFCEDVGPFQSSKTRAAKAAFFLGADAEARRLGKARVTHGGNSSGSSAIFTAIRRASFLLSNLPWFRAGQRPADLRFSQPIGLADHIHLRSFAWSL